MHGICLVGLPGVCGHSLHFECRMALVASGTVILTMSVLLQLFRLSISMPFSFDRVSGNGLGLMDKLPVSVLVYYTNILWRSSNMTSSYIDLYSIMGSGLSGATMSD